MSDNINNLLEQQKELSAKIKNVISKDNAYNENEKLKEINKNLLIEIDNLKDKNKKLDEKNINLKKSLLEKIYNERINLLNKMNEFIDGKRRNDLFGITEFKTNCETKIKQIKIDINKFKLQEENEILLKLEEVEKLFKEYKSSLNKKCYKSINEFNKQKISDSEKIKSTKLSKESISEELKKNKIEAFIGSNLLNKIGIFFILLGVIAFSQFIYIKLEPIYKILFISILGLILIVTGELFNKKKKTVFSQGLTSGGITVLFATIAISYFSLNLINAGYVLLFTVIITGLAFYLSRRYDSETIASFALVGGFLPILINNDYNFFNVLIFYFLILNLSSLLYSYNKNWKVMQIISLLLNIMAIIGIYIFAETKLNFVLNLTYLIISLIAYNLLPILYNWIKKQKLEGYKYTFISVNTLISFIFIYLTFYKLELENHLGLVSAINFTIYLGLGLLSKYILKDKDNHTSNLFLITSLVFAILFIPFQLDWKWVALGWLLEGCGLIIYGIFKEKISIRKFGYLFYLISILCFIFYDSLVLNEKDLYVLKFAFITFATIPLLIAYNYKKIDFYDYDILKCLLLIIPFVGLLYVFVIHKYPVYIDYVNFEIIMYVLFSISAIAIGYMINKLKYLKDNGTGFISNAYIVISIITTLIVNSIYIIYEANIGDEFIILFSIFIFVSFAISIFGACILAKSLNKKYLYKVDYNYLGVSIYSIICITIFLCKNCNIPFNNIFISFIYLFTSIGWIFYGFIKKESITRKFGLAIIICSIFKLFIIDNTIDELKVVSYFGFGICLLSISFIYHKFYKMFDSKKEVVEDLITISSQNEVKNDEKNVDNNINIKD